VSNIMFLISLISILLSICVETLCTLCGFAFVFLTSEGVELELVLE
jgi:hypothetical protein